MLTRLLIVPVLALLLVAGADARAEETPGRIIEVRSKLIVSTLATRKEEFRADRDLLSAFVRGELEQYFDRDYSARLVLGRHVRDASEEQVAAFADALIENLLNRYGDALLSVEQGLQVRIRAETPLRDGRMMRVNSEIPRQGAQAVTIDYLFRATDDGWKVFDVIVEGVSYVQTYRTQFDQLLRSQDLDTLTKRLAEGAIRAGG